MAKNTNKRAPVKHLRDGIKSQYPKGHECEICGTSEDLEYHHVHSLSLVWENYCRQHNLKIETDEDVVSVRNAFYEAHWEEVVTDGLTLCNAHHLELHRVYGKVPALSTAQKQKVWVEKKKGKLEGMDSTPTASTSGEGRFSKFLTGEVNTGFSKFIEES